MKTLVVCSVLIALGFPALGADKVRVFIEGQGTVNASTQGGGGYGGGLFGHRTDTTVDMHNESIELAKDMREQCPEITITLKEDAADYIVKLNRESKAKRGVFDKNTQVLVATKQGDVIWTKDVRQVRSAAKDACSAISSAAGIRAGGVDAAAKASETKTEQPALATVSSFEAPANASIAATQTNKAVDHNSLFERLGIKAQKVSDPPGVAITAVAMGSPAALAGLQTDYVINSVNSKVVHSPEELEAEVSSHGMNAELHLGYMFRSGLGWFAKDAIVKLGK